MITLLIALVAAIAGFTFTRRFVRDRLRYVDAVQKKRAPLLAGAVALAVATPVVWLLPVVGAGTALLFGGGVALGVHKGARDVRGHRGEVMVV
ncbi:MAG TPA: hypothetical protein VF048_10180 [Gemmatimonadaceae bacterium]